MVNNRIEEVKKILSNFLSASTALYIKCGNYREAELEKADEELEGETARQICQLFTQPLDDKELREKINEIVTPPIKNYVLGYIHNLNQLDAELKRNVDYTTDQIHALLPPKIEEAFTKGITQYREEICPVRIEEARKQVDKEWYNALVACDIAPSVLIDVKLILFGHGKSDRWMAVTGGE